VRLSIVVPTIDRTREPDELFGSLVDSSFRDFEVIVIDQNGGGLLDDVVDKYRDRLALRHVRTATRGLSAAKNQGALLATSPLVCFPDDDSRVLPNTISTALALLDASGADAVFGKCVDDSGRDSVVAFQSSPAILTIANIEGGVVEATMFARTALVREVPYDESLGAGRLCGAEEGRDFVIRCLKKGAHFRFDPAIVLLHPQKVQSKSTPAERARAFHYRAGYARVCAKHGLYGALAKRLLLSASATIVFAPWRPHLSRYYLAEFLGLVAGLTV
jgi:glycosyltransferase involved in cell wall biosynthesis